MSTTPPAPPSPISYADTCDRVRSQLMNRLQRRDESKAFATRGMPREVLSEPVLESIYDSIRSSQLANNVVLEIDQQTFVKRIEEKGLHDFLAVLIFARCSVTSAYAFVRELVVGERSSVPTSSLVPLKFLPATLDFLREIFGDDAEARYFHKEQWRFCTLVLEFPGPIRITASDSDIFKPWLKKELKGGGSSGQVWKVTIARGHMKPSGESRPGDSGDNVVARKDFMHNEKSFRDETMVMRKILSCTSRHINICTSLGTLLHDGPPPKFSIFMPWAEMDLEEYLTSNQGLDTKDFRVRYSLLRSAQGLAEGLQYLHEEMKTEDEELVCFHMDLKPSNVLIFKDENSERKYPEGYDKVWKVCDFGMSKVKVKKKEKKEEAKIFKDLFNNGAKHSTARATPTVIARGDGTFLPFDAQAKDKTDEKIDVWSLGCIISVLWTYMEVLSLQEYQERRRSGRNEIPMDVFYEENRLGRSWKMNRGVGEQHVLIVKASKKRSTVEGEIAHELLQFLEKHVLVDNKKRCAARKVAKQIGMAREAYGRLLDNIPQHEKQENWSLQMPSFLTRFKTAGPTPIFQWRLGGNLGPNSRTCQSSPDGKYIVSWSYRDILVFTKAQGSTAGNPVLEPTAAEGFRPRDEHSWRAVEVTNRFLIAVTEGEAPSCYIFDVEKAKDLSLYRVVAFPLPVFHILRASADDKYPYLVCILSKPNNATGWFWRAKIVRPPVVAPSARNTSGAASDQEQQRVGPSLETTDLQPLIWLAKDIKQVVPYGERSCYMAVQQREDNCKILVLLLGADSNYAAIKLDVGRTDNAPQAILTDTVIHRMDRVESQAFVLMQTKRISRVKFYGTSAGDKQPDLISDLPFRHYRILKIVIHNRILALGVQSLTSAIALLEITLRSSGSDPETRSLATLPGLLESQQPVLTVYKDGDKSIALVTATAKKDEFAVYQVDLSMCP